MPSFAQTLRAHQLDLVRGATQTLQVNLGLRCNQACRHCHLEAGPARSELMDLATVEAVLAYALRGGFTTLDITGGAPEMNPNLERLIAGAVRPGLRVMLRANLTALGRRGPELMEFLAAQGVAVVASFPSLSPGQADALRGEGVFAASLDALARLNALGYGRQGSGLELDLVANPTGAFLPPAQAATEKRYQAEMKRRWNLSFNHLYCFANVPLGRFEGWLRSSGNYDGYLERLSSQFNPCAVADLMCRSLVSVDWRGHLFDCDFNQAAGLPMNGRRIHVDDMTGLPPLGQPIALGDHCFTCTAGAGFT